MDKPTFVGKVFKNAGNHGPYYRILLNPTDLAILTKRVSEQGGASLILSESKAGGSFYMKLDKPAPAPTPADEDMDVRASHVEAEPIIDPDTLPF